MAEKFTHEDKIKHLEFIQGAITRMNNNSFQMKGWALAIVSTLLGFYANSGNSAFAIVAILPIAAFWSLDAYYLQQERKFRAIYDDVIGASEESKVKPFAMPLNLYEGGKYALWDSFTSRTIMPLYVLMILFLAALYFFL